MSDTLSTFQTGPRPVPDGATAKLTRRVITLARAIEVKYYMSEAASISSASATPIPPPPSRLPPPTGNFFHDVIQVRRNLSQFKLQLSKSNRV